MLLKEKICEVITYNFIKTTQDWIGKTRTNNIIIIIRKQDYDNT